MEEVQESNLEEKNLDFEAEIRRLEMEKKRMRDEFDVQRAKLKELFMQREDELARKKVENDSLNKELHKVKSELDDVKSQMLVAGLQLENNFATEKRKADEEIATLQQLVQETVDESTCSRSIYDSEVRKLHTVIRQLEGENLQLKTERQHSPHHTVQEPSSLAPSVVLSAVTKKIVKRLGADTFTSQDDDHREDPELLKSLLGPLEEEIKALKNKLRATDEQLQKCKQCSHTLEQEVQMARSPMESPSLSQQSSAKLMLQTTSTNTSFEARAPQTCDMCSNYEAQLVKEQKRASDLESKVLTAEKSAERHKEDLLKEIGFRKDMEEKWSEKKEEHKKQVAELTTQMECCEQDLKEVQDVFKRACDEMKQKLSQLTKDREKVQHELDRLQKENDHLVGKYSVHSQELQSEVINLPDTVEDLQELLLRTQQDLIIAKIGKEEAEKKVSTLQSDIMLLRDQFKSDQENTQLIENTLVTEINQLKSEKDSFDKEHRVVLGNLEKLKNRDKELLEKLAEVQNRLAESEKSRKHLEQATSDLDIKVAALQKDLLTSESVQKDFVMLSQTLQVQLEKIRDADTQVRWQHEEDVDECLQCRSTFTSARRKEHCKHCGQIFCPSCLPHVVGSGPNQRPSRVCDVCHTLLVKSSAPYFSKEAPHSPD